MSTKKKILAPLATLVVAGAIAVGSGATFSSTTENTISSVTSGTLSHTNSKNDEAIFTLDEMKPGDVVNGSLTLTNTGSLPASLSLTEVTSSNGFAGDNLTLTITESGGAQVFSGTFGELVDGERNDLGTFATGAERTYTFSVALDAEADNTQQGKTASATYQWDAVQLDGQVTNQ